MNEFKKDVIEKLAHWPVSVRSDGVVRAYAWNMDWVALLEIPAEVPDADRNIWRIRPDGDVVWKVWRSARPMQFSGLVVEEGGIKAYDLGSRSMFQIDPESGEAVFLEYAE